jgi:virulence-associated protein VapD
MKKLKDLLKESFVWERQFGEKLPTLTDVQKKYENKVNEEDLNEAKTNVGFSNEMGALYVSKGGGKSVELYKADVEQIIKQYKKFKSKMD